MTEEIDYSDPNEGMSSPDLMTSALGNLELIRDTHWSEKDRIGVPLDDDDPDEPGGADRLSAARCAITAIEILIARENAKTVSSDLVHSMHGLSQQLAEGYQTALEVDTMLETLKDACGEESSGFMCEIILRRFRPVMNLLDGTSNKIKKLEGASLTLDASVIRAIDGLYDDVIDVGILLANVPGEKEDLSRQDRTVTDCFNEACPKFSTIFAAIGKPHTRKPQSDQGGAS